MAAPIGFVLSPPLALQQPVLPRFSGHIFHASLRQIPRVLNDVPHYHSPIRLHTILLSQPHSTEPDKVPSQTISKATILNAAFLVSGTTIGGGFLALPAVVAPVGFYPSTLTLLGVWTYFLAQSFVLVECILTHRQEIQAGEEDASDSASGVSAVARSVLGRTGEAFVAVVLVVLMEATLVSQISRAGLMIPHHYRMTCAVSAISIAGLVFGTDRGVSFASKSNSILTLLFLLSAGTLFGVGVGSADWTRLGASGSMHWGMVPSAIPTFLQLLVYGEIVPCVCELLQYRRRPIQIAILLGSFLTLGLQIGWAALGTALVPVGTANVLDPVTVLLATPGMVRIPLLSLAVTAILTTILGTYLALLSSYQDLARNRNGVAKTSTGTRRKYPWRERLLVASIITAPALAIASTSPTIFLRAIDFAGSYPVLMLWGVLPPIISLMQRYRGRGSDQGHDNLHKKGLGDVGFDAFLIMLSSISLALVAMNVKNDMAPLLSKVASLLS